MELLGLGASRFLACSWQQRCNVVQICLHAHCKLRGAMLLHAAIVCNRPSKPRQLDLQVSTRAPVDLAKGQARALGVLVCT